MQHTVMEVSLPGQYSVRLTQTGYDKFSVTYGYEVRKSLAYVEAAEFFGVCAMHAACCAGNITQRDY